MDRDPDQSSETGPETGSCPRTFTRTRGQDLKSGEARRNNWLPLESSGLTQHIDSDMEGTTGTYADRSLL